MRNRGLHRPRVRDRVVLPGRVLRRVDRARVIARDDVDLPVTRVVPGHREAPHVRHRSTRRPRVRGHVIDASRVVVLPRDRVLPAEHIQLVRRRVIDGRSHDRRRAHRSQRRPRVRGRHELVQRVQRQPRTERITTRNIARVRIRTHRAAIKVLRHRSTNLPTRRRRRRRRRRRPTRTDRQRPVRDAAHIGRGIVHQVQRPGAVRRTTIEGGQVHITTRRRRRSGERITRLVVRRRIARPDT